MTTFEVLVLVALVLLIGLAVAAVTLLLRSPVPKFELKLDAIERQLSDSIGIVNLSVSGLREEVARSATALREEVCNRIEALGANLQTTLATIGTQQSERFDGFGKQLGEHRNATTEDAKSLRLEVGNSLISLGTKVTENLGAMGKAQSEALATATTAIKELSNKNEERQEALRRTVESRLDSIRIENSEKLEKMRETVDEKLQATLEQRLGASFTLVNENLERVYKSVGEMQSLATGVGDLKRVLSNVKLRGSWGEGALGDILDDMLTTEQFSRNVEIKPQSGRIVEFALRLPGSGDEPIWVPIDAKMPHEDYERLTLAAERGDVQGVEESGKALERCIMRYAKDICEKYVCPPHSTDFAILFLPSEGLFAEVVRRPGLVDKLRSQYRVAVTGPTTLTAFLHSLRMGFKSLAIQQRSSEVWQVLGAVKTEFSKFGVVLDKVHKKLGEAQNAVEDAHKRRRAMDRKLRDVEALPDAPANDLLALAAEEIVDEGELPDEAAE